MCIVKGYSKTTGQIFIKWRGNDVQIKIKIKILKIGSPIIKF